MTSHKSYNFDFSTKFQLAWLSHSFVRKPFHVGMPNITDLYCSDNLNLNLLGTKIWFYPWRFLAISPHSVECTTVDTTASYNFTLPGASLATVQSTKPLQFLGIFWRKWWNLIAACCPGTFSLSEQAVVKNIIKPVTWLTWGQNSPIWVSDHQ